jgi:hypothetical protein
MKQGIHNPACVVNQVKIEFTQKPITAWGGIATLIAKFLEVIEFRSWVETNIPIKETSPNGGGIYEKVLAQFLTALVGGDRFSHLLWLSHGIEAIKKAFGVDWLPKASSTLTRFWGKFKTWVRAEALAEKARALAVRIIQYAGIGEDNLNLDSRVLTRYGQQEGAKKGYNPKKRGRPSHHPLLAYLGSGYLVNLWNRSGDTFSGQRAKGFFQQSIQALGAVFKVKRVLCDTGFYLIEFIKYLESEHYTYIIAARLCFNLQKEIDRIKDWKRIVPGIEVASFYFQHGDKKWEKPRRYVVVRQEVGQRPQATGKQLRLFENLDDGKDYRFSAFITNDEVSAPEEVWREYRPRANDENVNKELKEGYGFDSFCLHSFYATEAVMIMNALVFHNLICLLNQKVFNPGKPQEQLKTLRGKYFIIPAMLGASGGYPVLRLGVSVKKVRSRILYLLNLIAQIKWRLNCIAVRAAA